MHKKRLLYFLAVQLSDQFITFVKNASVLVNMISLKFRSSTVLKLTTLVSFELALACHLIISLWFVPRIFKIVNYGLKFAWSIGSLLFSESFLGHNRRTMNRIRWKCVINVLWPKHLSQKKEKRPARVGTIDFQKRKFRSDFRRVKD